MAAYSFWVKMLLDDDVLAGRWDHDLGRGDARKPDDGHAGGQSRKFHFKRENLSLVNTFALRRHSKRTDPFFASPSLLYIMQRTLGRRKQNT